MSNRHHECKIPKARPPPTADPKRAPSEAFPGSGRGSSIFPVAQAKPVDSSPLISHVQPDHAGISLLYHHPWSMAGLLPSSLLPGPSSVHCWHSSPTPQCLSHHMEHGLSVSYLPCLYSPQQKECSMKARLSLSFISCCVPAPRTGHSTSSK